MSKEIKIKRLDDRSVFRIFKEARRAGEDEIKDSEGHFSGVNHSIRLVFSTGLPWEYSDEEVGSCPAGLFTLSHATLSFSAEPEDGGQRKRETITFSYVRGEDAALADKFKLSQGGQSFVMSGDGEQAVQKAIHRMLSPLLHPVTPEDGGLVPTLSNLAESFGASYQRISEELSSAVSAVNNERTQQFDEFQAERKRQQQELAEERASVLKDARNEIEAQRSELQLERKKLEEEWLKLEASSHKDARRKQFTRMQDDLRDALNEPVADSNSRRTRWAVFFALVITGICSAFFAYLSISQQQDFSSATASWLIPTIRTMVLTFASLGSFLGAAAWLRYFYVRDLQAQEELRSFRNDMARASWVMDAALEIRKEHNETIPPEWIIGVTEGLFARHRKDSMEEGAQALAALMGLSASASFGPGGTTVELSKKGSKALSSAGKGAE